MLTRLAPILILAGLVLLFFAPLVVQPDGVLYSDHSDLLAHYLPAKRFLVESWRETGEFPLWCPYSLGGMPFVHDPQVGAFYPPHWLLFLLPLDMLGAGLSWLIVAHLLLAGWGTYACAREQGLDRVPALVAGVGFLFAGKWLLHLLAAGHYTTIGLAWLPWALLCLERALRRGGLIWGTWAGVCYALVILGTQPQWAFYAGIFLALWSVASVPDLTRWLVYGAWASCIAVALTAVQLLPTWEAAAHSTRGGGVPSEDVLGGGLRALMFLVGPALTKAPANLAWEDRGGFGLLWLVAAALAPVLCKGRVRRQAGVCLALILFGVGGAALLQWLPGFGLFRQPTRMMLIAALPVALLAGATTQALYSGGIDGVRCRRVLVRVAAAIAILVGGFAVRQVVQGKEIILHPYWIVLIVTIPAAYWVLSTEYSVPSTQYLRCAAWGAILLLDLWALTWPLVAVRDESDVYAPSACVRYLSNERETASRVLDVDAGEAASPLGRGAPLALRHHLHAVRGYNPLDVRRYKEYLQLIAGDDAPPRPFEHPLAFPIVGDLPVENRHVLDLLGVRYLLQPRDAPMDGPGWRKVCDDSSPSAFDVVAGGRRALVPYCVYENEQAFPRAFVVARAAPLGDLKDADFRHEVLLEDAPADETAACDPGYWSATIRVYQPNRVVLDVSGTAAGWLVLTDVWYPGWICTVDGAAAKVYRADYLFRAVRIEAGQHEVVFRFEPRSYQRGLALSLLGLIVVLGTVTARLVGTRFLQPIKLLPRLGVIRRDPESSGPASNRFI